MKRISIAVIVLISTFSAMAQDNKPVAGCFGVGYVVGFFNAYPQSYLNAYQGASTDATISRSKSFSPKYLLLNL